LAFGFYIQTGEFIHQYFNIPSIIFRGWAGFALIFISTLFIFSVITYVITKIFVRGPIKGIDRVLGLGFGALRGVAIVVAMLVVARGFGMDSSDTWQNSNHIDKFRPFIEVIDELFRDSGLIPSDDEPDFQQKLNEKAVQKLTET
jgi:membrane protein required for colicin V production